MIDLFYPYVPRETVEEVGDVLRSRWIGQGPKVNEFEKQYSKLFNQQYCVAMSSGTAALETAYDLVGLKAGDEVITTPLTCTATNISLLRLGVKIVWADILKETLCINPLDVMSKITSKTKAIVQVHLGGIRAEVQGTHIPVISDACQALGIFTGDITCNSFQAIKHITTGDGGMITLPNNFMYKHAKLYRWFGIDRDKKIANNWQAYISRRMTFDIEVLGAKRQMTDIAATMGIVGLKHYNKVILHREKIFNIYRKELIGIEGLTLVDGKENTYWLATLLVENRDDFAKMMFEADIDTNVVQVRNDIYRLFGGKRVNLPVMNEVEHKYLSIPVGMNVTEEDAYYICDTIKKGW